MPEVRPTQIAWLPELTYVGGRFERGTAVVTDERTGRVVRVASADSIRRLLGGEPRAGETYDLSLAGERAPVRFVALAGRALLPGMANAHSHAFQRVIRGRTEYRTAARDSFWTWREQMYAAAERLTPEDLYDASRMAFLEMALSGTTAVGEFHYLHHDGRGRAYDDPNLLPKQVVRAARDVGIRVALLRVAYARSGFETPPDPRQSRFITADAGTFLRHLDALGRDLARDEASADPPRDDDAQDAAAARDDDARNDDDAGNGGDSARVGKVASAWAGVAPHSVRAVPLAYLREVAAHARGARLPVHMHVAEQPAENEACLREHGRAPVRLLADEGLLDERFTAVHAVHVTPDEARALASAQVCACPTTERNLGDGVVPADLFFDAGTRVSLGTDSHAQIDLLEDARELEYHLRLQKLSRAVLAPAARDDDDHDGRHAQPGGGPAGEDEDDGRQLSALAERLFDCATANGARALGYDGGSLREGSPADFFTIDLADPSVAGACADDLLPAVVFSLSRAAVREVVVGGRAVVESGRHAAQDEIVARFRALQRKLWGGA